MGTKRVGWARIRSLINENGNQLKILKPQIISASAARTLTAAESGATIYWSQADAHDITLPTATVGLNYTFILAAGSVHNHYIVSQTADVIFGKAIVSDDSDDKVATQVVLSGAGLDKVHLHKTSNNTGGDAGDTVHLVCGAAGYWLCTANLLTTGTPTSIATLTD